MIFPWFAKKLSTEYLDEETLILYKENLALSWTQISKYDGNALLSFTSHQCVCQGVCVWKVFANLDL